MLKSDNGVVAAVRHSLFETLMVAMQRRHTSPSESDRQRDLKEETQARVDYETFRGLSTAALNVIAREFAR